MQTGSDPNIWVMLYDHTPPALRWLLGALTLGYVYIAKERWSRHQERLRAVEDAQRKFATKEDIAEIRNRMDQSHHSLHSKVDRILFLLIEESRK